MLDANDNIDNQVIWRYMSVEHLKDILENKRLYMHRVDLFRENGDEFEGRNIPFLAARNKIIANKTLQQVKKLRISNDELKKVHQAIDDSSDFYLAKRTYISCWNMSENESYAMWKIYGNCNDDKNMQVAIKTTIARLKKSILDYTDLEIRPIKYESLKNGIWNPIWTKHFAYSYEHELRVAKTLPMRSMKQKKFSYSIEEWIKPETCLYIPIDPLKLIDTIYIGPNNTEECYEKVCAFINYSFYSNTIKIKKSAIHSYYEQVNMAVLDKSVQDSVYREEREASKNKITSHTIFYDKNTLIALDHTIKGAETEDELRKYGTLDVNLDVCNNFVLNKTKFIFKVNPETQELIQTDKVVNNSLLRPYYRERIQDKDGNYIKIDAIPQEQPTSRLTGIGFSRVFISTPAAFFSFVALNRRNDSKQRKIFFIKYMGRRRGILNIVINRQNHIRVLTAFIPRRQSIGNLKWSIRSLCRLNVLRKTSGGT